MAAEYRFRFICDESFVKEIRSDAQTNPSEVRIESETTEKEATRLGFDLATAAAVITIIAGSLDILQVAAKIFKWFEKSSGNKIVIQTPLMTLEFVKSSGITQGDVEKMLKTAMKV